MARVTRSDFYGRKSSSDDGRSVASQEKDWLADCAANDFEQGRKFSDPDRSASRYAKKDRPDYAQLLAHIASGDCEMLALWESARGSRDLGEWAALLGLCRTQGVLIRVISHGRTYDVRNRRDWRALADEAVDAADESEKISERTLRGKRDAAAEGRPVGRLGYGWKRTYDRRGRVDGQLPDPQTAPFVREMIERIAKGDTCGAIARDLNERKVPAAEGGTWTDRQVRQLAIRPVYAGLRVHRGKVIGEGTWAPLVAREVWERAHARLTAHPATGSSYVSHWCTGAVRCGLCDGNLRASPRKTGDAYGCRDCFKVSASARGLEGVLEPLVLGRLRKSDVTSLIAKGSTDAELRAAIAAEQTLRDRLEAHYDEAARGDLSAGGLAAVERRLLADIETAAQKVARLALPSELNDLAGQTGDEIAARWPGYTPRRKRDITRLLADIRLLPGTRYDGPRFNVLRLGPSRWIGDSRTWGEIWEEQS